MTLPEDPKAPLGMISMRVADRNGRDVIPGSSQLPCSVCSEAVWVGPDLMQEARGRQLIPVCMVCFKSDRALQEGTPLIPPGQREYLKRKFGCSDQELEELLEEVVNDAKYG